MAVHTPKTYRNLTMYSVFVRNYSEEGTFEAVRKDLDRIQNLGVDIIWLMPIHPIGEKARKGSVGSPYAIADYRKVNPEFGTVEDLKRLAGDVHSRGMKIIIDVVYNHTSPDSWLSRNHPEWFYHKPNGSFGNRVGDWTDIIDLDYHNKDLWTYQIDTLKMWAEIVDGFRGDVAPLIPLEFWLKAREEVEKVRPGCFWLAESIEPSFITYCRSQGMTALSDSEIYQAFDVAYDYDIYEYFRDYLNDKGSLSAYADAVTRQEGMYPDNYVKLRCLENHDRPRIRQQVPDKLSLRNWTAFNYFQKGIAMIFNGQEVGAIHLPNLFEKDPIRWQTDMEDGAFLRKLSDIRRDPIFTDSTYTVKALKREILLARHEKDGSQLIGVFSVRGQAGMVDVGIPNGTYENLLGGTVEVHEGKFATDGQPVIIKA